MPKSYFDFQIRKASDPNIEVSKDDYMFFVERKFNAGSNRFEYQLSLVIRREHNLDKTDIDCNYMLPCSGPLDKGDNRFIGKYLYTIHYHGKEKQMKRVFDFDAELDSEYIKSDGAIPVFPSSSSKDENTKYYYFKHTFTNIPEDKISGMGIFGLSDDEKTPPTIDHMFCYYTEFIEKPYVFYEIHRRSNRRVRYTIENFPSFNIEGGVKVALAYSKKYLYKTDLELPNSEMLIPNGEHEIIESSDIMIDETIADDAEHLSLFIKDKEAAKLVLLVPKLTKTTVRTKRVIGKNTKNEEHLCPYCMMPIKNDPKLKYQFCDGGDFGNYLMARKDTSRKRSQNKFAKKTILCRRYLVSEKAYSALNDSKTIVPFDDKSFFLKIPKYFYSDFVRNVFISILGRPSSGKSVFLSTLFGLQGGGQVFDDAHDLSYLNRFTDRFNNTFTLQDIEYVKNGSYQLSLVADQKYDSNEISNLQYRFSNFVMNYVSPACDKTDKDTKYYPFMISSKKTSITIKDIAGEDSEEQINGTDNKGILKRVESSDAFLVCIDPTDPTSIGDTLSKFITEGNKITKPVAIVLTKFDTIISGKKKINNLNPNLSCLNDATFDMIDKSTFSGSTLEKNIVEASEEIRQIISDHIPTVNLKMIDNNCTNVRYFAVSSLGDIHCVSDKAKKESTGKTLNPVLFYNTPFRVELPILWLLYQTGVFQ